MADDPYFSLPANDLDIFDANGVVTRPQGYTIAGSSMMHPFDSNSFLPGPPTIQYTNPQPAVVEYLQPVPTYRPPYPNVQGTFNAPGSLILSQERSSSSAIFPANNAVGLVESFYPNHAYPSNSSGYHQRGASNFTAPEFYYPPLTSEPATSSSRQTLADVQPDLYHGEADYPTWGDEAEAENDGFILDLPLERRQKQSRNRRPQPYDKQERGTRQREATPMIVPSNFDPSPAIATFLNRQAIVCPILIQGVGCGQSVNTAQEMRHHLLNSHTINAKKKKGANAGLGGRCPQCNSRVSSCIYRHIMSDFYHYACPVEGCGKTVPRPDQLRAHCKDHGFQIPCDTKNEHYAVRKV